MATMEVSEKLRSAHRAFLVTTRAGERLPRHEKDSVSGGFHWSRRARTRTADPFITSEGVLSVAVALGRSTPHGDTNIRGQKRTERTANDNLVCAWCARPRGRESYALEAP
jgi:hypothetical protein